MASNGAEQPVDKETAKEHFRSSRLSWSNQAEHVREARVFGRSLRGARLT